MVYQQAIESSYWGQAAHMRKSERNKNATKRFYNHYDADFSPKLNLFNGRGAHTNYNA